MTYSSRSGFAIASAVALGLGLVACTPKTPAQSSSAVLTPERTWVIVSKPIHPAALDTVRLFTQRGFPLVDATSDNAGMTLRFKGHRKYASEEIVTGLDVAHAILEVTEAMTLPPEEAAKNRHYRGPREPTIEHYEIGSVFYVRIEKRGETMTSIAAIGRPTRSGAEACTPDPELSAPCLKVEAGPAVHPDIAGFAEAELINGVFAEMRVAGSVVAPDLAVVEAQHQARLSYRQCWEARRQREELAARVSNPKAKAGILRTAPTCAMAPQPSLAAH